MKKFVLLLFCAINVISISQTKNCLDNIKTGTFYYDSHGKKVIVKRTKRKQIEYYNNGNSKIVNRIEWVSDTEYILTFVKEKNSPGCLKKGDRMKITILECNENTYKAKIESKNCGNGEVVITIDK